MARIINYTLKNKNVKRMTIFLVLMALIGVITGGDFIPVVQDFLAIFFFSFFYFHQSRIRYDANILANFIERFFLYITGFETFALFTGISGSAELDTIRVINLVVCPFFLSLLYLNKKKTILSLLFFVICTLMTIRSAMRINFFFPIIYTLFLLSTVLRNSKVSLSKKVLTVALVSVITIFAYPKIQAYIEADASRNLHMVTRTEGMFDGEDSESTRRNTNMLIIYEADDFILPQGIGWMNHVKTIMSNYRARYGVMSTMDSNLLYCVYHFGLFFGLAILIMIIWGCLKFIFCSLEWHAGGDIVMAACFVTVILVMFLLKSWIFVYSSFGLTYGLLYAYSRNLQKYGYYLYTGSK